MRYIALVCILVALSPVKGRVLSEKTSPVVEKLVYNGTFHTINAIVYKHTWVDFPDFGKECTAYINAGGVNIESPYMQGEMQLRITGAPTLQQRDTLKGVLCDLMRTGEYKSLTAIEALDRAESVFYRADNDNGSISLNGPAVSLISVSGGTIHFYGCSC